MVTRNIFLLLTILSIASCDSKGCEELVLDSIKHHDTTTYSGKKYYLYSRTTGWHEKIVFFELYEQSPIFDECNHSTIKPVFTRAFDETGNQPFVKRLVLQPNIEEKLKIIYTTDKSEGVANIYDVKFTQ